MNIDVRTWPANAQAWARRNWLWGVSIGIFAATCIVIGYGFASSPNAAAVEINSAVSVEALATSVVDGVVKPISEHLKSFGAKIMLLQGEMDNVKGRVKKIEDRPTLDLNELEKQLEQKTRKELQSKLDGLQKEASDKAPNFTLRPTA